MKRKQLKRQKGFKMLPNSRSVARPSRWGNPYPVRREAFRGNISFIVVNTNIAQSYVECDRLFWRYLEKEQAEQKAVELHRDYAIEKAKQEPEWLGPLRDLDCIYCWCAEDAPWCHGDNLIELLEKNESTT